VNVANPKGSVIDEIIRLSDYSFERMPMLDILGERFAENFSIALPDLTHVICEVSMVQLDYLPMAKITESLPNPAIFAVCGGSPLEGEMLISIDSTLLLASIELILGGDAKEIPTRETKGFTTIERGFGTRLARLALEEFQQSLSVIAEADLTLLRSETNVDAANVTNPASLCIRMKFSVAFAGHAGSLEVIIPYDALEPLRPVLSKVHFGERNDGLGIWQEQLKLQIQRAMIELEATLCEFSTPIQQIMAWKPGSVVELNVTGEHEATLTYGEVEMFKGSLGKKNNGKVAVQITEKLDLTEEQ
jgi:flagellar motor switch protein FliM